MATQLRSENNKRTQHKIRKDKHRNDKDYIERSLRLQDMITKWRLFGRSLSTYLIYNQLFWIRTRILLFIANDSYFNILITIFDRFYLGSCRTRHFRFIYVGSSFTCSSKTWMAGNGRNHWSGNGYRIAWWVSKKTKRFYFKITITKL